jgi:hypothetical protein
MRLVALRIASILLLAGGLAGCIRYEYDHEFWLDTDGSGTVQVSGRPALWAAFKGVGTAEDPEKTISREELRRLFERSGLRVRRVLRNRRAGKTYLFVSATFKDLNALGGSPAFPDLAIHLGGTGEKLRLEGAWQRPPNARLVEASQREGLMAVRFHLPSKVFEHKNASDGVERGNILSWRQDVSQGFEGPPLAFGALMGRRSILSATVTLFVSSILAAAAFVALLLYLAYRQGKRRLAQER